MAYEQIFGSSSSRLLDKDIGGYLQDGTDFPSLCLHTLPLKTIPPIPRQLNAKEHDACRNLFQKCLWSMLIVHTLVFWPFLDKQIIFLSPLCNWMGLWIILADRLGYGRMLLWGGNTWQPLPTPQCFLSQLRQTLTLHIEIKVPWDRRSLKCLVLTWKGPGPAEGSSDWK